LGQPTNDNLKELYKTQKASTGLRIGVLASNQIVQQQTDYGSG
jgi:hypothetical protein